ncbi:hypothetical protein [Crateriforma conspicua]|uniref:Uncharacterized protein n=1 Tax=Crateriforma conspicua TaxID=2527996 RepID=A0A5C6FJA0_9PLAN|nr:hypothetical protein [Crateriforma conspicua]TWU62027.1 hypothetical protein V7x_37560 [Crateriforma conspicua]
MNVNYIPIGSTAQQDLPISTTDISAHLLADWLPNLPLATGASFFGWPSQILFQTHAGGTAYLTIHRWLGQSERQWKGVISWMLGVAGGRRVLSELGYRWVAPASAFYPESVGPISVSWPNNFPRANLSVTEDTGSSSRLRPDYIALKPVNGGVSYQLAAAEAKGTSKAILSPSNVTCPASWYQQVRNIRMTLGGVPLYVPRHIVIATRVNPNAVQDTTRQLAIRAWNSNENDQRRELHSGDGLAIVVAHLFGFYRNIGFVEIANELAVALTRLSDSRKSVQQELGFDSEGTDEPVLEFDSVAELSLASGVSAVIRLSKELIALTKALINAKNKDEAAEAIASGDRELDVWNDQPLPASESVSRLSFGVEIEASSI